MIRRHVYGYLLAAGLAFGLLGCAAEPNGESQEVSAAEACQRVDLALQKMNRAMEPAMTATSMESLKASMQSAVPYVEELAAVEAPESVAGPRDELVVVMREFHAAAAVTVAGEGLEASQGAMAGPLVDLAAACGWQLD